MSALHWMPLYIGDELAKTAGLEADEFGAYMRLSMHYFHHGGLPAEEKKIARIAGIDGTEWARVRSAIYGLFGKAWRSDRLDRLRFEAQEKHEKRVAAGKRGGRPRRDEKQSYKQCFSDEEALPNQPQPQPQPHIPLEPKSHFGALEGEGGTYTREERNTMFSPLAPPSSPTLAAKILKSRGVPDESLPGAVQRFMDGLLSEFDIEGLAVGEVLDATA